MSTFLSNALSECQGPVMFEKLKENKINFESNLSHSLHLEDQYFLN